MRDDVWFGRLREHLVCALELAVKLDERLMPDNDATTLRAHLAVLSEDIPDAIDYLAAALSKVPMPYQGDRADAQEAWEAAQDAKRVATSVDPSLLIVRRAFYFGCWEQPGHGLFDESFHRASRESVPWPSTELDGSLCIPTDKRAGRRLSWPESDEAEQPQGKALIHHRSGWTALSFWDRTGDSRGNSNSTFLFDATLDFRGAVAAARERFPLLFERFSFEITEAKP